MVRLFSVIASPLTLVSLVAISYCVLLSRLEFVDISVRIDLAFLGLLCFTLLVFMLPAQRRKCIWVSHYDARKLLTIVTCGQIIIMLYLTGNVGVQVASLLDARFAVPGFGPISSFYIVSTVLGFSVMPRAGISTWSIVFIILSCIIGYIIGGKGAAVYILMGFGLSARAGIIQRLNFRVALLAAFASFAATYFFFALNLGNESVWDKFTNRLLYSADALLYVSQLNIYELTNFRVTAPSFVADLILRFAGQRVNELSVGAELASIVSGTDSGAGPNPIMPVLVYLITQANVGAAALLALLFLAFLLALSIFCELNLWRRTPGFYFCAALFFMPVCIIDVVLLLQILFWIVLLFLIQSVRRVKLIGRISRQKHSTLQLLGGNQ